MNLEVWIVLIVIFLIGELLTGGFYLLSLSFGSLTGLILNYLGFPPYVQIIGLIVITLVFLIISRPLANKFTKTNNSKVSNTERHIGNEAVVIEDINPEKVGKVQIGGEIWLAKSDKTLTKEDKVTVSGIEGVKLIVK